MSEPSDHDEGSATARALPSFRYHPDPVASEAIVPDEHAVCARCGLSTGWVYAGAVHGGTVTPAAICPWCIADGSASAQFGVTFVEAVLGEIPPEANTVLHTRTPGYVSWQGEQWIVCCGDAAAFLGPVGWADIRHLPDAVESLRTLDWPAEQQWPLLRADGDISGYLFRCLHCGSHHVNADGS